VRTTKMVERELAEAEAIAANGGVDQVDDNGTLVMTAAQHRASYSRRAERLRRELADLRQVVERGTTASRRQPVATRVAAVLAAAGHQRATNAGSGRGVSVEWLDSSSMSDDPRVLYVFNQRNFHEVERQTELAAWAEVLTAAGYRVECDHHYLAQPSRITSLRVLRWSRA